MQAAVHIHFMLPGQACMCQPRTLLLPVVMHARLVMSYVWYTSYAEREPALQQWQKLRQHFARSNALYCYLFCVHRFWLLLLPVTVTWSVPVMPMHGIEASLHVQFCAHRLCQRSLCLRLPVWICWSLMLLAQTSRVSSPRSSAHTYGCALRPPRLLFTIKGDFTGASRI